MIIVNADDFGYSEDVNGAIIEAFEQDICSSTTIMPNAGHFEDACLLAAEKKLNGRIGIHMILVEGQPLTDEIKKCARFCDDNGMFHAARRKFIFKLNPDENHAAAKELRSQITLCRKNGMQLTHADSHRHMHEEWALAPVFVRVCKEEGIPFLRLARNCGVITTRLKRLYRNLLNSKFRKEGLAGTDYFGSAADFEYLVEHTGKWNNNHSMEIMIHPGHKNEALIDRTDGRPLSELAARLKAAERPVCFGR